MFLIQSYKAPVPLLSPHKQRCLQTQCLASWFSCQEVSWIFEISCQDFGNYSWQGSQDFARFFKIAEENPRKVLGVLANKSKNKQNLGKKIKKVLYQSKLKSLDIL